MRINNKKGWVQMIFIAAALLAVVALILVNFNVGREVKENSLTWRVVEKDSNAVTGNVVAQVGNKISGRATTDVSAIPKEFPNKQIYWDASNEAYIKIDSTIYPIHWLNNAPESVQTAASGKTATFSNDKKSITLQGGTTIYPGSSNSNDIYVKPQNGIPIQYQISSTSGVSGGTAQPTRPTVISVPNPQGGTVSLPTSVVATTIDPTTIKEYSYNPGTRAISVVDIQGATILFTQVGTGGTYSYSYNEGTIKGTLTPIGNNHYIDQGSNEQGQTGYTNLLYPDASSSKLQQKQIDPNIGTYLTRHSEVISGYTFDGNKFKRTDGSTITFNEGGIVRVTTPSTTPNGQTETITIVNSNGDSVTLSAVPSSQVQISKNDGEPTVVIIAGSRYYADGADIVQVQNGIMTRTTYAGTNAVQIQTDAQNRITSTQVQNGPTVTTQYDAITGMPTTTVQVNGQNVAVITGYAADVLHSAAKTGNGIQAFPGDQTAVIITKSQIDLTGQYQWVKTSGDGTVLIRTGDEGFQFNQAGAVFNPKSDSLITVSLRTSSETDEKTLKDVPYALAAELDLASFDKTSKVGVGGVVFQNGQLFYKGSATIDSWAITYASDDKTRVVTRTKMTDPNNPNTYTEERSRLYDSATNKILGARITIYADGNNHQTPKQDMLVFSTHGYVNGIEVNPGYTGKQAAGDPKGTWTIESTGLWTVGKYTEGQNYGLHVDVDSGRVDIVGLDGKLLAPTDPAYQAILKDKKVQAQSAALKENWNYESTGLRFNAAYQAALAANRLSSLLCGGTDCFYAWRKGVEDFFDSSLGWISNPESTFCRSYVDKGGNDGYAFVTDPYGAVSVAAHVEGEKSLQIAYVNDTNSTDFVKEYLYKFTYSVRAPVDQDIAFRIELSGPKNKVSIFDGNRKLTKGTTDSAMGQTALVKYSRAEYNQICLVFDGNVDWKNPLCNKIVDQPTTPTIIDLEARNNNPYGYISGYNGVGTGGGTGTLTGNW